MMIKNQSRSRNWNWKLVENVQSNKSDAKHSIEFSAAVKELAGGCKHGFVF